MEGCRCDDYVVACGTVSLWQQPVVPWSRQSHTDSPPPQCAIPQWANGGGGLQSPTSQHGGHQNRRTRQGLVWCIIIITHSHKCTHRLIWVGGTVCQKIAIYKALILSHRHFVFSAGGGELNAVRWRTRMFGFRRWRTSISDARLDRFIKMYIVCGRVFDWSWIIIFMTRHKHALTEATLWLQINCKHIFVQLWWSMWIQL